MKNLASAQIVKEINPILKADKIELATVLGWKVVVKKDEFKVGDLCAYIQIDTIVPEKPYYEFLRERKFRVRTIKLRKQISQGLIVPLPEGKWKEGDDLTKVMNIKKYEKPDNNPNIEKPRMPKNGWKKYKYLFKYNILYKLFPFMLPKRRTKFPKNLVSITDEERIQNMPQILEQYRGKKFVASYKLDGSSITIIHNKFLWKHKYRICSRRFELHDKSNDWYKVFKSTNFEKHILKLVNFFETNDIIVQGEAIGKFNGNPHNLDHNEIRVFNIFVKGIRINQLDFDIFDIPVCPIYKVVKLDYTLDEILKESEIQDIINPNIYAEGLVWRCIEPNDMTSFKVINNKYLIKYGE